ncbi:MAG: hypothetical protein ACP5G1_03955 [Nanopusillaceae archaeon]
MEYNDKTKRFRFNDCKDKQCFKDALKKQNIEIHEYYDGILEEFFECMSDVLMNILLNMFDYLLDEGYEFYIRIIRDPCSDEISIDFVVKLEDKSYESYVTTITKLNGYLKQISGKHRDAFCIGFDVRL